MLQCMRQLSALECHFVARALDLGRLINVSSALTKYEQGLTFPSTRRERERERSSFAKQAHQKGNRPSTLVPMQWLKWGVGGSPLRFEPPPPAIV